MIVGVALDVEEVRAAQMGVPVGLARPDPARVDLPLERRPQAVIEVELHLPVDVLEGPAHPRDHHVPGANSASVWPGSKIQVAIASPRRRR
jgi:hypothetical protein